MSNLKVGDRVVTWMEEVGEVVGPAPRKYEPYEWMVLIDGDKYSCPYLGQEVMLEEEYNELEDD